ncbi:universal stress protein [Actinomadura sp. DC4]|uniref:universal stress protein n=1 Tax=Actinomadura sp. DC4 TaxID=3055069 RepID=UPI0025B00271|nr:universal stress protein [Actinomadura sp. DC4]MDN3359776.1 universal stress protein [Actinomadura sp. DC4]
MSVLVGIDDSVQGTAALRWAAREAALRKTSLRILHAFPWSMPGVVADPRHLQMWDAAQRLVAEAEYWAKSITPEVGTELVTGGPSQSLIRRSDGAEIVVVGTRGHGGFHGLLMGSVASQVAGHASCPVVLVGPETEPTAREVVLGVGDRPKEETLGMAFGEAALRGAPLRALRAWQPYGSTGPGGLAPLVPDAEDVRHGEELLVAGALAPWQEKYPRVSVVTSVVSDTPAHALVNVSGGAALLVVGAREHEEFLGLPLGSVTHLLAHHAKCPVLIAR